MPQFEEHELMAYADGELAPARAAELAAAATQDAALAQRIERYAATRRILQGSFSARAEEPVPQRLLDLLAEPKDGKVVSLEVRRKPRPAWLPLALAASLVLAVGLLSTRMLSQAPDTLSVALESLPSGASRPAAGGEIVALSTLRTDAGEYCREYERSTGGSSSSRGLACRDEAGRWAERTITGPDTMPAGGYETASGESTDAAAALKAQRLTPQQEQELIQQHWR